MYAKPLLKTWSYPLEKSATHYIFLQRKVTISLENYPFFSHNRTTKEEYVTPEISLGFYYLLKRAEYLES